MLLVSFALIEEFEFAECRLLSFPLKFPMQKRMKSAHPRTPGGRQPTPKGSNTHPQPGSYTKFTPVQAPVPKRTTAQQVASGKPSRGL